MFQRPVFTLRDCSGIDQVTGILGVRQALEGQGVEPAPGTPAQFRAHMEREIAKFRTLVRTAKIAAE